MKLSLTSVSVPLITLVALLSTVAYIDTARTTQHRTQQQELAAEKLDRLRERIESRLYRGMSHAVALRSFALTELSKNETISNQDFLIFAESLPNIEKTVLGLQLAPKGIIRYVFPLSDSSLVGIDLLDITKYNGTVQRALRSRRMIVDGPRMLAQGRLGLVARHPIFNSSNQFWGFSTVIFDFERLAIASELEIVSNGLRIAIRGKDGKGSQGDVFFGDPDIFISRSILKSINFQNGSWQIAAIPEAGWSTNWPGRNLFIAVTIIISLLITFLIWRNSQHKYQLCLNEQLLLTLAAEDSLTKLANRRTLHKHLEVEWKRAARMKTPLSLLMIDIDFFKNYNDYYGHLEGDKCLCIVANEIKAAAKRPADLAARFGGEEFVLVLPDTSLEQALKVAKNLLSEVVARKLTHADDVPMEHVTVSIGVASRTPSVEKEADNQISIRLLLEDADNSLYRAKEFGRNRFESIKK